MNTTVRLKASDIYKDWRVIDAAGRPLGRVASEAAIYLRGKHKPTYEPHLDDGDFVIVINAGQVRVTGRKAEQIKYHSHSGYPGGLRTRTFVEEFARYPERVIERAVWGMLPGGTLGEAMIKHLKVYRGAHHPHQSQITGSERARAAREAAQQEALGTPMKAPRLRKLSVPYVAPAPEADETPESTPVAEEPSRSRFRRGRAPASAGATEAVQEAIEAESGIVETTGETPAEAAVEAQAPATREEPEIVTSTGTTPAEAAIAAETEAADEATTAPKPRSRRRASAEAETPATEEAPTKPARRRATPKTED
jgi:large subunit ribosomal protein L13